MNETLEIGSGTFINQVNSVPVGDTYTKYQDNDGMEVALGDMVYFDDPDAGMHINQCPLVMGTEFVGYVDQIYAFDPSFRDSIEPEVGCTAPLGRLGIGDRCVTVIPTEGDAGVRGRPLLKQAWSGNRIESAKKMAETLFKNDQWKQYYERESHGGGAVVGQEFIDSNPNVCSECSEGEFGPNISKGK